MKENKKRITSKIQTNIQVYRLVNVLRSLFYFTDCVLANSTYGWDLGFRIETKSK